MQWEKCVEKWIMHFILEFAYSLKVKFYYATLISDTNSSCVDEQVKYKHTVHAAFMSDHIGRHKDCKLVRHLVTKDICDEQKNIYDSL